MIEIKNVSKSFNNNLVLKNFNLNIEKGSIFGLIGINGAGKSTLLRILAGIYNVDSGSITINNNNIYNNKKIKKDIFFLPDDPYYSINLTGEDLKNIYKSYYNFDEDKFYNHLKNFNLKSTDKINDFSKGMKRQLFISLAISCNPKYILLDEAFDGLDPLARLYFKRELIKLVDEFNTTVIISSHALRELEDICDSYGLIDNKEIISSGDLNTSLESLYKYRMAYENDVVNEGDFKDFDIINFKKDGKLIYITFKGNEKHFIEKTKKLNCIYLEKVPQNFEDLFIEEVKSRGYLK